MAQSRKASLIEAAVNTLVAFIITWAVSPIIYWVIGLDLPLWKMGIANVLFTLVSVIRNYFIRRWFNGKIHVQYGRTGRGHTKSLDIKREAAGSA
jgi:membrane protein implicated in regulation of membrane protease activity